MRLIQRTSGSLFTHYADNRVFLFPFKLFMATARDIDPGPVAVARAVIRRPLTAQARARSQPFHEVDKVAT